MLEPKLLNPILEKHGLELVEGRYLKGKNYEDGTVGWEATIDSMLLNDSLPSDVLKKIGELLNPPIPATPRVKKTKQKVDTFATDLRVKPALVTMKDAGGTLRGEARL